MNNKRAVSAGIAITLQFGYMCAMPFEASAATIFDHRRHLTVDGERRSYVIHAPRGAADQRQQKPLVIVLHGGLGNAWSAKFDSQMSRKADQDGFYAVYPNGSHGLFRSLLTWNAGSCCGPASVKNANDMKFLRLLIEKMENEFDVDPARIYVTGISNGGMLAYRAACDLSDVVAAVAPVEGCMTYHGTPKHPVSVLAFNGTKDTVVRHEGGTGSVFGYKIHCSAAASALQFWARHNGCDMTAQTERRGALLKETYTGGRDGTEVCLYTFPGRHWWPGGRSACLPFCSTGRIVNATDEMCEFFWKHPKIRPQVN
jgi:polyhydroxybutyrate depolymerase